ncbi:aspartate carbamoyltransferase [Parasponia andersonii]|uniref:Aspartate carbamoyltransferase n=1 Tax=Parasponia andersonii TaxID=3476 RepID=A0A2P5CVS6_PARAD|nr:aspartate carbamoyltransferase [Parasponia andersonii]
MGLNLMLVKKIGLLFLLISGTLLSTSLAGRQSNSGNDFAEAVMDAITDDEEMLMNDKEIGMVHERLLKANTKDYGKYDPAPALVKPPFKLIPN